MSDYPTKTGVFSILEKQKFRHSNMYSAAPDAVDAAARPIRHRSACRGGARSPGLTGCIRLPFSFAPKLYKITNLGDNVVVARGQPSPKLIAHPNLFQPPPTQAQSSQQPEDAPGSPADDPLSLCLRTIRRRRPTPNQALLGHWRAALKQQTKALTPPAQ